MTAAQADERLTLLHKLYDRLHGLPPAVPAHTSRIPNGWSGVPWGKKLGFTSTDTVNQPAPNTPAFDWDGGYNGVVKAASLDSSAAATIWGPVSWDPNGGRVSHAAAELQYPA